MPRNHFFPAGKLPADFLSALLRKYTASRGGGVLAGPGIGEDAAALKFGGKVLIAKTDPVTFAGENVGHYAVNVNANDVAAMGGKPLWFLACLVMPEKKTRKSDVKKIFAEVHASCRQLGILLCGGHTEISPSVNRPVVAGCMLGEAEEGKLTPSGAASPGDDILLTKGIAVEGVSLIASAKGSFLKKTFSGKDIERMKNFIFSPGISVVREALLANSLPGVRAMHDPTEGGLSSALWEVSEASSTAAEIEEGKIPLLDECLTLCGIFGLNPLGLISSGSLLLYCDKRFSGDIMKLLKRSGIPCAAIGRALKGKGVYVTSGGKRKIMPRFDRDEITRVL